MVSEQGSPVVGQKKPHGLHSRNLVNQNKFHPDRLLCLFCNNVADSREHLFFQCSFVSDFWMLIRNEVGSTALRVWHEIFHELVHRRWHSGDFESSSFSQEVYITYGKRGIVVCLMGQKEMWLICLKI
ncbi:hypothetical protein OSB04_012299 [Centaurea solstitialis]|uniref:Reverse transcriptase zinc-binding domain-containing protein n=1 Tax=Centaurea solstitialis TaxID=347529 RepID=A0AA38TB42_9ASTR|nr:hypothetical protein OSB04_012299 [Centaurea solstitialis]